jgi:hypothetical protein
MILKCLMALKLKKNRRFSNMRWAYNRSLESYVFYGNHGITTKNSIYITRGHVLYEAEDSKIES